MSDAEEVRVLTVLGVPAERIEEVRADPEARQILDWLMGFLDNAARELAGWHDLRGTISEVAG